MRAALTGAALFIGGLALGACAGGSTPTTTNRSSVTRSVTTNSTVTTSVETVVGTTPSGETLTQTSTRLTTTPAGPDGVPLQSGLPLGETSTTVTGQTIDGIQCQQLDQLAYQTSAHLQVYVDGRARSLPASIGLVNAKGTSTGTVTTYSGGLCAYWVHTAAANGIIEVRSPVPETYTLGDLFDIWNQPLSKHEVALSDGLVTATVNGKAWSGDPREIPLREHESIQLAVGRPVPGYKPVDWSETDL